MKQFPIGVDGEWFQPGDFPIPDAHLKNWLMDTGSLTERLQSACRDFEVMVLGQALAPISELETRSLYPALYSLAESEDDKGTDIPETQVREVILKGDGQPWVFARSLLPQAFIDTCMSELGELGNKPLGKILFNDERFQRQPFELLQCVPDSKLLKDLAMSSSHNIWGRRSVFQYQAHRIMVIEMFLPFSPAYREMGAEVESDINRESSYVG
ncbi:chorismate lyase [Paraneptunicella aestuarii]|uniref:chorismate--pyruvate lyase family protein n=1 Tax=Paraneptunicella aestuarii TaxID=2831148 RepID=UPI001E3F851B|nr:chorismate lyase [Paraneptunicella aestuarii]UAA38864.1 chorismate lyase [Paraneptunicella aestuarii]